MLRIVLGLTVALATLSAQTDSGRQQRSPSAVPSDPETCFANAAASCRDTADLSTTIVRPSLNGNKEPSALDNPAASEFLSTVSGLELHGEFYHARRLLKTEAPNSADIDVLAARARLEDWYGSDSSNVYAALMTAEIANLRPSQEVMATARRGLEVAIRSGRLADAAIFAKQLTAFGDETGRSLLRSTSSGTDGSTTELIGGVDALQFSLTGRSGSKSEEFLADYARTLADEDKNDLRLSNVKVHIYFQQLAELMSLGERKPEETDVVLSLADRTSKHRTEAALKILGLKIAREKHALVIRSIEKKVQTADLAAALAVDVSGLQEALRTPNSYTLRIPVDHVSIFPAESIWKNMFQPQQYAGGLFEAFTTDQRAARLYLALNSMDRGAAEVLYRAVSPRKLADDFSVPLSLYSAALSLDGSAAEVPGGKAAYPQWTGLAGANPVNAAAFFHSLIARDDGRMLAFFYTLSQLDSAHQRFFVKSPARIKRYYEYFRESAEMRRGAERLMDNSSFVEFLREVPLNDDGTVDFPGAPEVWMVAKGQKNTAQSVAKLTRKMKKKAAPDDEDEILLRLARTEYKSTSREQSELANFVAVCRLDAERDEPMSPESALILAQNYAEYRNLYPYFAALGDLEPGDYKAVFDVAGKLSALDPVTANTRLGEFHSVLALLVMARRREAGSGEQELSLMRKTLQRYSTADSSAAWTQASLDFLDGFASLKTEHPSSRDGAVRDLLLGGNGGESMLLATGEVLINPTARRRKWFNQVLFLQKAPALDELLAIRESLNHPSPVTLERTQQTIAHLVVIPVPKRWRLMTEERRSIERFQTASLEASLNRLRSLMAKRKRKERDTERDSEQILADLEPWTQLAMSSLVYASYLNPGDLIVSEDPMLSRKHQFLNLGPANGKRSYFNESNFLASSDAQGSYFTGGFSDFSSAAGQARTLGNHAGPLAGDAFAVALFASIRGTDWQLLNDAVLQAFAARIRIAREWVIQSAQSQEMLAQLREESRGLVSLTRRKMLLNSIADRDWSNVWKAVSDSDLYFLGDALCRNANPELWRTPALQAMRKAARDLPALDVFGQVAPALNGCSQTHLRRYEPYEEYELYWIPSRVAQRAAELKFALAWLADSEALPAQAIAQAAPFAADVVLKKMRLRDPHDWRSALLAYDSLRPQLLEEILTAQ